MKFKLYNTLTKKKEDFKPMENGKIRLYVCGITVYDYCHIGHARVLVAFDVIVKFLRSQGWDVDYVRNITDVDDKIINRAKENQEEASDLSERFIEAMWEDEGRLGIARPDKEPKATAHIEDIIQLIQSLEEKGFAYLASNGDVYYRVAKFASYGQLTNKNIDELQAGARVDVDAGKEDPRDFVLWKSAKAGEVSWQSPWGLGRPGWHIECSAMSKSCLGETLDIHGGGPDLPFPHHENEIAQSEAANGCKYVNYWMHAGALRVDGEKMSKSLGNFFTIRDVLERYHPEVVRFLLISSQYRSPINYSEESLIEAKAGLDRFYRALRGLKKTPPVELNTLPKNEFLERFNAAMADDFNTPLALAAMYDLLRELNSQGAGEADEKGLQQSLISMGAVLGILQGDAEEFLQGLVGVGEGGDSGNSALSAEVIEDLIAQRQQAKLDKQYGRADEIRNELADKGIVLEDNPGGTSWRRA